jgi:GNAT superfamily N-acetyltransferase
MASPADVEACFEVQRRSALVGYAHIFAQDEFPFPDDVVRSEWVERLAGESQVVVAVESGSLVGTVSARGCRLEALFVVPSAWGTGVAGALHDRALSLIASGGSSVAELDVMVDNTRARRFL